MVKRIRTQLLWALAIALLSVLPVRAADRPNIVLFIVDDMTWFDAGCYGSADVKTPNLDRLSTQGMRFTRCFTSTAMCAPTRQQLYTGLWPVRSGAYPNHSRVKQGTRSLGHHFKQLGYRVAIAGKKHFGPAESYPFETLKGGVHHDNGKNAKNDFSIEAVKQFIARDPSQPYFMICATNQPHAPWNRGDASAYNTKILKLPPYLVDTPETREALAAYYAEITYADKLLGGVMAALDEAGQADNSILLFTSEQGSGMPFAKWTCYEAGLKTGLVVRWPGKVKPGSKTEAMVQYVDIVPTLLDAAGGAPSEADTGRAGDADGGSGFDGSSFLGVLTGQADSHRDYVFGIHTTRGIINGSDCYPIRSIRGERYKLILNLNHGTDFKNILMRGNDTVWESWVSAAGAGNKHARDMVARYRQRPEVELYDLESDPHEMNNLAGQLDDRTELRQAIVKLKPQLLQWMEQQGDKGIATEMQVKPRK